jgi:hypothetical protein
MYHCIVFDELDEGAAFIAALSRYLVSPSGPGLGMQTSSIEVFAATRPESRQLMVYLSDAALDATATAFGQPVLVEDYAREAPPINGIPLLSDAAQMPFGKDDILRRIISS